MRTKLAQTKYRADIDGLRAVAIISVIGFHTFPGHLPGGFIGVDIFFVISGFLISSIIFESLNAEQFSMTRFYVRRIKRIFPALIVVLISVFLAGWFILFADEFTRLGGHIATGAAFISNFIFWSEADYFDKAAIAKPLLHLWSLGIEEQFYIFWPMLIYFAWKKHIRILFVLLTLLALSFLANIAVASIDKVADFYSPMTRLWELLIGSGLAYYSCARKNTLFEDFNSIGGKDLRCTIGAILIIVSLCLLNKETEFPGWAALLPTIGAAFLISAGTDAWLNRILLSNPIMVWVGLISYPLYLWHWPLLSLTHSIEFDRPSPLIRVAIIAVAALLAWITYVFVEKPIRRGVFDTQKITILTSSMLIVGGVGLLSSYNGGFPSRRINLFASHMDYDWRAGYRYRTCFLDHDQPGDAFDSTCVDRLQSDRTTPLVLLWGDSHAASLYPGLRYISRKRHFRVAQFTALSCWPLLADSHETELSHCGSISNHAVQAITELRPDAVVLSAYWAYDDRNVTAKNRTRLIETINTIKKLGVKNIFVFGELPVFTADQPRIGAYEFIPNKRNRTLRGFDKRAAEINRELRTIVAETPARFVSPIELLCNEGGCLMSTRSDSFVPLAWDYGHLTAAGSVYLLRQTAIPY